MSESYQIGLFDLDVGVLFEEDEVRGELFLLEGRDADLSEVQGHDLHNHLQTRDITIVLCESLRTFWIWVVSVLISEADDLNRVLNVFLPLCSFSRDVL